MRAAVTRWRWVVLGAVAALGAALVAWMIGRPVAVAVLQHPYFAIDQMTVDGAGPALSPDDVRAWLGFDRQASVWGASPGRLRARLEAHPFIAHAAVRREFPRRLEITIRERRPRAIAVLDDLYYVDRRGALFGPLRPDDPRDLPFITGVDAAAPPGARSWHLRRALRLLRRFEPLPSSGDVGRAVGALSEVHVDGAHGVTVFPAAPRVAIVLGWGSWSAKLARAERALANWHDAVERVARIDARFRNQVVATLRPLPAPPAPALAPPRRGRDRGLPT